MSRKSDHFLAAMGFDSSDVRTLLLKKRRTCRVGGDVNPSNVMSMVGGMDPFSIYSDGGGGV